MVPVEYGNRISENTVMFPHAHAEPCLANPSCVVPESCPSLFRMSVLADQNRTTGWGGECVAHAFHTDTLTILACRLRPDQYAPDMVGQDDEDYGFADFFNCLPYDGNDSFAEVVIAALVVPVCDSPADRVCGAGFNRSGSMRIDFLPYGLLNVSYSALNMRMFCLLEPWQAGFC